MMITRGVKTRPSVFSVRFFFPCCLSPLSFSSSCVEEKETTPGQVMNQQSSRVLLSGSKEIDGSKRFFVYFLLFWFFCYFAHVVFHLSPFCISSTYLCIVDVSSSDFPISYSFPSSFLFDSFPFVVRLFEGLERAEQWIQQEDYGRETREVVGRYKAEVEG